MSRYIHYSVAALLVACGLTAYAGPAEAPDLSKAGINIPEKPEFLQSVGVKPDAKVELSKKEKLELTEKAYQEKVDQHFMSVHAAKGVSCSTCHDPRASSDKAWMAQVTKPVIRQTCQDCHAVQADVVAHTDTHSKVDCIGCHMPNVASAANYSADQKDVASGVLRRFHAYKIKVDPQASSYVKGEVEVDGNKIQGWVLSKDEDGNAFVDLMWSCARNAPGDYTVFEGQGCHSQYRSTLDEGLVYQDQKEIYGEANRWQQPVKEGYKEVVGGINRINKLLEVTRLKREDQTEVRLLLDKATDIADLIRKDGSWGMHAHNYLKDRVMTAQAYLRMAQEIIDQADFQKTAAK